MLRRIERYARRKILNMFTDEFRIIKIGHIVLFGYNLR